MSPSLKIFLFLFLLIQLFLILKTIKIKKMTIRYGSFWIFIIVLLGVAIVFPNIFITLSNFFGFETTSNMIFLIGFFFLFYLIFILTISLSKQHSVIKILVQEVSILKSKIQSYENERSKETDE